MVIGIDPSLTSTGVCIDGQTYLIASGTQETKEPLRTMVERIEHIVFGITELCDMSNDPALVFYIEGPMLGPAANHLFEMGMWFNSFYQVFRTYRIVVVHPQTLKKYIGVTIKKNVALAVFKRWGVDWPDDKGDDRAHAYALYKLGHDVENGQYTLPEAKRRGTGARSIKSVKKRAARHTAVQVQ